jgi:hypothetical membrane protein
MIIPITYFVIVIIVAHYFVPRDYYWVENTISEMAAQHLPNGWIMRLGFIGFGMLLIMTLISFWIDNSITWWLLVPFIIYGVAVLLTGIWSTEYKEFKAEASAFASKLHSLFAALAGIALTMTIVVNMIITQVMSFKWLHLGFVVAITLISLLFAKIPKYQGIIQRVLYLTSFIWMLWFFGK